ncbi:Ras GEF [Pleurostoma richardsiae]|uniref:Ras GEF n=1 Tax=Pleurostoma richardsiae TaxID=41990 RepID=A0AA38R453_9PEZI|nr:Ras GEF [Pleurostoma richardsiae]
METINIAVIGSDGVGKSSFVQRALRLTRSPTSNISTVRMEVEGVTTLVTLIELDLAYFDVSPGQQIHWPKQVNGHMVPRVDGAMVLYDVMNKDSIRELPPTLSALANSALPTILVATKCDNPESLRQIDTAGMAAAFPSCLADFKTSSNVPGSTRECLQVMLRAAVANRRGVIDKSDAAVQRRRAASTANLDAPQDRYGTRPESEHSSKHSRASSDLSLIRGFMQPDPSEGHYRGPARSPRLPYATTGAAQSSHPTDDTVSSMLRTPGVRIDAVPDTFLDVDESDAESYRHSDDIPILQRNDEAFVERPAKVAGVTFDELVDRLLAPRMSRADNNFADIFLCLYRKFAAPGELFSAILTRLDRVKEDKTAHYLMKTATQLRIIEVVAKWVATYPGDFARPTTRRNLEDLIKHLSTEPIFSAAANQMRNHLENNVVEDDDTDWAKSDKEEQRGSNATGSGLTDSPKRGGDLHTALSSLRLNEKEANEHSGRPSQGSDLSHLERVSSSNGGASQFQFHSYEDYEREAATMVPQSTLPLNKFRYHIFIDADPDDIADEITRIDWVMFSSIRIRDLVRHVSLSAEEKERCRSLRNVNRMIAHFNHVAKWVANMVLIRDKAKHRAPILEKFMNIALKLRQLNNYNGLAAVLAGINGAAVHRLAQTRALVSPEVQKRFARLVLLMGTQKSHFAYRLAWENSPLPRIPFMPLHRRDLVSAEEGSRTFVGPNGDRINWKKFEVLGEVLLPIMKSQGTPYPNLHKHEMSRELILDCRMETDEENIYQRSCQVEPMAGGPADPSRKKFPWLAK